MTTPGPWKVGDREPYVEIWGRMSMSASPIIASMEHEPRKENAEMIVMAVNAIGPLRKAASDLLAAMDDMHNKGETFTARVSITASRLRGVLGTVT